MIKIEGKQVGGITSHEIPDEDQTIDDAIHLHLIKPHIDHIEYYQRNAEDCPWARGNWIIDIYLLDGNIFCIRLPLSLSIERIKRYLIPVQEYLNEQTQKT